MEQINKILLIEPDYKLSFEISTFLTKSGYEITDSVPYIFSAINSIDKEKPDVIMIDEIITEQKAEFISKYIKLPLIIITTQFERNVYLYSDKIRILSIINKPFDVYKIKIPVSIAFSKLVHLKNQTKPHI